MSSGTNKNKTDESAGAGVEFTELGGLSNLKVKPEVK
jgi:hypothetical protein